MHETKEHKDEYQKDIIKLSLRQFYANRLTINPCVRRRVNDQPITPPSSSFCQHYTKDMV